MFLFLGKGLKLVKQRRMTYRAHCTYTLVFLFIYLFIYYFCYWFKLLVIGLTLRRRRFFSYTEDGWGRFLPHAEYKYTIIV